MSLFSGELIAAFGYEQVCFSEGPFPFNSDEGFLSVETLREGCWVGQLREQLVTEADALHKRRGGRGYQSDNKEAFLWMEVGGYIHLVQFRDGAFSHLSWYDAWAPNVPANIFQGRQRVIDALAEPIRQRHWDRRLRDDARSARGVHR